MVDSENVGPSSLDSKKSEQDKAEKLREEAQQEKDRGNKFVRLQKWDEAISCYTRAINFCCTDAIFYANRGLCYLKKENMYAAESDCTRAIDLDPGYVKALQRRSTARLALGSLKRASEDLQRILEIDPSNKPVKQQLRALMQRIATTGTVYKSSPATTPSSDDSSKSYSELFESNEHFSTDSPEPSIKIGEIKSPRKVVETVRTVNPAVQKVVSSNVVKEEPTASPSFMAIAQSSSSRSGGGQTSNDAAKSELDKDLANQILLSLSGTQNLAAKTRQEIVMSIDKPPHLRSKKPLVRVPISEIPRGYVVQAFPIKSAADGVTKVVSKNINKKGKFRGKRNDRRNQTSGDKKPGDQSRPAKLDLSKNAQSEEAKPSDQLPKDATENVNESVATEDAAISEVQQECVAVLPCVDEVSIIPQAPQSCADSVELNELKINDLPKISFPIPKSSVQFTSQWRLLRGRDKERSAYLKSVPPTSMPDIFQNFLESDTLSEILTTIVEGEDFNKADGVPSLPYLQNLCKVKRFGALAMFLSNADKQGILKILERSKEVEGTSLEDINDIKNKYEL